MKPILIPLIESGDPSMRHLLKSDAENMEIFLDYVDKSFGGDISIFLKKFGMTDEEIEKLRGKITA